MLMDQNKPPWIVTFILKVVLPPADRQFLLSDFEYIYHERLLRKGILAARMWYWSQLIKTIPAFFIYTIYWSMIMLINYIKITIRNLKKHMGYSFINVFGLAAGLASFIFIMLYVQFELSYDTYHEDAERIYRVAKSRKTEAKHDYFAPNVIEVAPTLKDEFPEVVSAGIAGSRGNPRIRYQDKIFIEEGIYLANQGIFDILSIPFISGKKENVI